MESSHRRSLIEKEKINQRGFGWGVRLRKLNTETEQLALLPRISPSGSFGFLVFDSVHVRKVGAVVIIVVLFFSL